MFSSFGDFYSSMIAFFVSVVLTAAIFYYIYQIFRLSKRYINTGTWSDVKWYNAKDLNFKDPHPASLGIQLLILVLTMFACAAWIIILPIVLWIITLKLLRNKKVKRETFIKTLVK